VAVSALAQTFCTILENGLVDAMWWADQQGFKAFTNHIDPYGDFGFKTARHLTAVTHTCLPGHIFHIGGGQAKRTAAAVAKRVPTQSAKCELLSLGLAAAATLLELLLLLQRGRGAFGLHEVVEQHCGLVHWLHICLGVLHRHRGTICLWCKWEKEKETRKKEGEEKRRGERERGEERETETSSVLVEV